MKMMNLDGAIPVSVLETRHRTVDTERNTIEEKIMNIDKTHVKEESHWIAYTG